MRWVAGWRSGCRLAAVFALMSVGCRSVPTVRLFAPPTTPAPLPSAPGELPNAPLTLLEPDYKNLPLLDPAKADITGVLRPQAIGVTEETVVARAGARAAIATALEKENEVAVAIGQGQPDPQKSLARELRPLIAADARNKAIGEAVVAFYQLGDLEGRGDIVRSTIESLDKLQAAVKEARAKGAKPPIDEEELDRQRATWIGLLGQAELGTKLLDQDLKRRIGASGKALDRLQPSGDFRVSTDPIDVEAAVKIALERRQDLLALRTAYLKLGPEQLPEVRDFLKTIPGTSGGLGQIGPRPLVARFFRQKMNEAVAVINSAAGQEVEIRKQQLFLLIEEKERAVADEVRAQEAILMEQARQVGLARWRAEKLMAKLAELRKDDKGAAAIVPLELEANRARADVIQAVMGWQQARAKLKTAQGLYGSEVK